eukprot:CAMPEP_0176043122 /NCGR_PEP_ID=MMETSP0120_2-20121206/21398_1 /TAXON_ID=160619 /ORGANISM="Kryptoperidinium foliaceum, Strain CCMP 1326" /LENGTH=85 /DNA_ID=CAMNT_0017376529 /DNA_START=789 /DNA_END=1043 /DNA_ORIENTATION=+
MNCRDARHTLKVFDQLGFVHEHRVSRLHALDLRGELLSGLCIDGEVDVAEGPGAELLPQAIDASDLADLRRFPRHCNTWPEPGSV